MLLCVSVCEMEETWAVTWRLSQIAHTDIFTLEDWKILERETGEGEGGGCFILIAKREAISAKVTSLPSSYSSTFFFFFFWTADISQQNPTHSNNPLHWRWWTADTKIEVLLIKSKGIKASCFWIWRRLDYSFACFAYSQLGIMFKFFLPWQKAAQKFGLFTCYLISFVSHASADSPDVTPSGWLGSKH